MTLGAGGLFTAALIALFVLDYMADLPDGDAPHVTGHLSEYQITRPGILRTGEFDFVINLENHESKPVTVYVVVYGTANGFSPPLRNAWPLNGVWLWRHAGTRRGVLYSTDIRSGWKTKDEHAKGFRVTIEANGSWEQPAMMPLGGTSPHPEWKGQRIGRGVVYDELSLWVHSEDGKLAVSETFNVRAVSETFNVRFD